MKSVSIKKCSDDQTPEYTSKFPDGNRPSITTISGGKTNGSRSKLAGFFSNKRNGIMFTESPVLGASLCPGYVYQDAVPGFAGAMAAVADCPEGVQWNSTPFIEHDWISECHFTCYVKIDITKVGNEAPTWVPNDLATHPLSEEYNDGDYVSWDPGVAPYYLRRYRCMTNNFRSSSANPPHLDTVNWRSNSDDFQALQIKAMRPMTSGAGHSGITFFTITFEGSQDPENSVITKGAIQANYQGEDHTGGSESAEFDGANIIQVLGGDWLCIEGYGKASTATGVNDGAIFLYIRNERTKQFGWQYIDKAEGNRNYNDRRLTGSLTEFFEQRTVVDVGWPKAGSGAGPYTFPSNRFIHIHFKRETTALKVYSSNLMINDSPESTYLIDGPDFATAMKTGKFMRQKDIATSTSEVEFEVNLGELATTDTIYVVRRNSNGKISPPVLWRNPV